MLQTIDTLITAPWVVPIEPEGYLEDYAIAINNGKIIDILPIYSAKHYYNANYNINFKSHVLMPGLVNSHTHASMTLLRGIADELPMMFWLKDHIWPIESKWVSPTFVRDGAKLAIAEMLRSGTTCFNDMYMFPEAVATVVQECGIRACIGLLVLDLPTNYASNIEEYLAKGLKLYNDIRGSNLIKVAFAPHAPYTVPMPSLITIKKLADDLNLNIHMHVHETSTEVEQFKIVHGCRPLEMLNNIGLLSEKLLAVHMTQLEDYEFELLVKNNVSIVHCPESNMKLASGICPVAKLHKMGINVAIGTDGAASNNDLDLISELRTTALFGKIMAGDATVLPAQSILRMATLHGAKALGMSNEIGSLTLGKLADIIAIDFGQPEAEPIYNPISQLVYSTSRHQVTDVWIAGKHLLVNRQLTSIDVADTINRVQWWKKKINNTT